MSEATSKTRITRKRLELYLQQLERPEQYDINLEQYVTDPLAASGLLFLALANGDISGKTIADLGSGSGVFACGAGKLGASKVFAVEIDRNLVELIRRNASDLPVTVVNSSVEDFTEEVDTVFMNPPFGSVDPGADRMFLEKAMQISQKVYSIHNRKSAEWVENFYSKRGKILSKINVNLTVPHIYPHHTRKSRDIEAVAFVVEPKH